MYKKFRTLYLLLFIFVSTIVACSSPAPIQNNSLKNTNNSFKTQNYNDFATQKTFSIPYTTKIRTDYYITYWLPEGGSGACPYDSNETTNTYYNKYISFEYKANENKWYVYYNGATYPLSENGGSFSKDDGVIG